MINSTHGFDDPVWTAYVLDELPPVERQRLEERLARDPGARSEIQTLRETVALVFAALQSEPVGELTPDQRQRIRTAARRRLTSLAATEPARGSFGVRGPTVAGGRATRGAVLLASLAMVAVALVVVSVAPDTSPTVDVRMVDKNGDVVGPRNFLVYESAGRDSSGTEHVKWMFTFRGEFDPGRLQRDTVNGIRYFDVPAAGADGTRRMYLTSMPSSVTEVTDTVAGNALFTNGTVPTLAEALVPTEANLATDAFGVRFQRHYVADRYGISLADSAQSPRNGGQERVPNSFVTGNRADFDEAAIKVEIENARPSGQPSLGVAAGTQVQAGGESGKLTSGLSVTTPPAGLASPAELTIERDVGKLLPQAGGVSRFREAGQSQNSAPRTTDGPVIAGFKSSPSSSGEPELKQEVDDVGRLQNQSRDRSRRRMAGQQVQGNGGAPPGADPPFEQSGQFQRADGSSARRRGFHQDAKSHGRAWGTPIPAGSGYVNDGEKLNEKSVRLLHDMDFNGIPAQDAPESLSLEGRLSANFNFFHGSRKSEEAEYAPAQQETAESLTFVKQRAVAVLSRFSDGTYAPIVEHDFTSALDVPVSTFSIDTDTAAYSNVRRFLVQGQWPDADAVRIEELVNYFPYDYEEPTDDHPVSVTVEAAACPWQPDHRLARIALKAREIRDSQRPPTSLVFLVDVSGSMQEENKLPLAQQSLRMLIRQLTDNDQIALVTYADHPIEVLDSTAGSRRDTILSAVNALHAEGSTNGAGGLTVAYNVARRHYIANGANRVILCSDGDFNVGISDDDELVRMIEEQRKSGVFLSICGFGTGNVKDGKLERLADHGNGQYFYIDSVDEARKAFVEQLMGTLYTVAKDVKLQIDFNPLQVAAYRLVGYENRDLAQQDFDNDGVDAGELGSGHTVTALYEYVPRAAGLDVAVDLSAAVHDRSVRFGVVADGNVEVQSDKDSVKIVGEVDSEKRKVELEKAVQAVIGSAVTQRYDNRLKVVDRPEVEGGRVPFNDTLTVRLRYKLPTAEESTRLDVSLVDAGRQAAPSPDFEWASAVAAFGLLLRQSQYRELANFDAVLEAAQAAKGDDPTGRRREFVDLVRQARSLSSNSSGIPTPAPVSLSSVDAYQKAAVAGKYANLLDKVPAPDDFNRYGDFHDYGRWVGTDYGGRSGLPPGYWVYVYPDWFIWGSQSIAPAAAAESAP